MALARVGFNPFTEANSCPRAASSAATARRSKPRGRDADTLGPSDTSDSGSDIQGATRLKTDAEEGEETRRRDAGRRTTATAMPRAPASAPRRSPRARATAPTSRPDRIARSKDALDSAESITGNDDSIESLADDSEEDGEDDDEV